jgi:predicted AAA+ superfamily ATPase
VDAALRNAVLLRGEEILTNPNELGVVVETAVLRHLYAYSYLDSPRVAYWREPKTDKEVDVIVKSPKYTIPVEVKYRSSANLEPTDGLVKFSRADESVTNAYLVSREDKDFGRVTFLDHPVKYLKIPAHIFVYLLGQAEHSTWERKGKRAGR